MRNGEVNPLNVFDLREVPYVPLHFKLITFTLLIDKTTLRRWIYEQFQGRFCIEPMKKALVCVGFEDHSEAMMFALMVDQINR